MMNSPVIFIAVILLILAIAFLLTVFLLNRSYAKKTEKCRARITATVADVIEETTSSRANEVTGGYTTWVPIFEYIVEGSPYRTKGSLTMARPDAFRKGDRVEIMYDPDDLKQILYGTETWKMLIRIFLIVTIALAIACAVCFIVGSRSV